MFLIVEGLTRGNERKYDLNSRIQWTIGRQRTCDIVLSGQTVSRVHATISVNLHVTDPTLPPEYLLLDGSLTTGLNTRRSRTGILKNGTRVDKSTTLAHGDVLTISGHVLRLERSEDIEIDDATLQ